MGVKLGLWHKESNKDRGVSEQVAEENTWTEEGWSDGRMDKTAQRRIFVICTLCEENSE
jgi:hypothetical protein